MNQEIEGKVRVIIAGARANALSGGLGDGLTIKEAIKAIQELVVSTVPDEKKPNYQSAYSDSGFNLCREEILKKWKQK